MGPERGRATGQNATPQMESETPAFVIGLREMFDEDWIHNPNVDAESQGFWEAYARRRDVVEIE